MQMSSPDSYKMNEFPRALHFENRNYLKFANVFQYCEENTNMMTVLTIQSISTRPS